MKSQLRRFVHFFFLLPLFFSALGTAFSAEPDLLERRLLQTRQAKISPDIFKAGFTEFCLDRQGVVGWASGYDERKLPRWMASPIGCQTTDVDLFPDYHRNTAYISVSDFSYNRKSGLFKFRLRIMNNGPVVHDAKLYKKVFNLLDESFAVQQIEIKIKDISEK